MNLITLISENKFADAKQYIFERLFALAKSRMDEAKQYISSEDNMLDENRHNIIRLGKINRIKRRVRRDSQGRIIVQTNRLRSTMKGYAIRGKSIRRISAVQRLRQSQQLKRSWKSSRRAKLSRSLLKRKMSMRRRHSLGLR